MAHSTRIDQRSRATLDDIAQHLGLNPSTVSRALSGTGRVSAATELRVRQTALDMGYIRPSFRQMIGVPSTSKDGTERASGYIAIIVPSLLDPPSAALGERMQSQITAQGWKPVLLSTGGEAAREYALIHTWNSMADGFVLVFSQLKDVQIRRLAEIKPTVVIGRRAPSTGVSHDTQAARSIVADERTGVNAAIKTLWNMGHRSVTYLSVSRLSWANNHRRQSLWQQAMRYGMSYRVIEDLPSSVEAGSQAFTLFNQHRTDAVVAFNNVMAIGFMKAAASAGCNVPQDVSIIGFGDTPAAILSSPTLSAIQQPVAEMADLAVETVLGDIESHSRSQRNLSPLATRFIQRDSVARKPISTPTRRVQADSIHSLRTSTDIDLTLMASTSSEIRPSLDEFERHFPNIHVHVEQSGPQAATLTRLHNRMDAKRNVPDLFRIEYDKLPQLALEGKVANLRSSRVEREFSSQFLPRAWASAHYGNGLFAVPTDVTPMVMFYRKDIFKQYNLPLPRTWRQYHDVGVKLRSLAPGTAMGCINAADAQHYLALLRMSAQPMWTLDESTHVQLSLTAPRIREAATMLQRCLDDEVLTVEPQTTHNLAQRLHAGLMAAPVMPSWFANTITQAHPEGARLWAATLPPAFGNPRRLVTSTAGGSALAINASAPRDKQRAAAAAAFWLESNPTAVSLKPLRTIPAARCGFWADIPAKTSQSSAANKTTKPHTEPADEFFGDALRPVFAEAVQRLDKHWQPLPFMTQVDDDFRDTVIPMLTNGGCPAKLLEDWQSSIASHAHSLGFTVR